MFGKFSAECFILGYLLKAEFNFIGGIQKKTTPPIVTISLYQQLIILTNIIRRLGSGYQYHNRMAEYE